MQRVEVRVARVVQEHADDLRPGEIMVLHMVMRVMSDYELLELLELPCSSRRSWQVWRMRCSEEYASLIVIAQIQLQ